MSAPKRRKPRFRVWQVVRDVRGHLRQIRSRSFRRTSWNKGGWLYWFWGEAGGYCEGQMRPLTKRERGQ